MTVKNIIQGIMDRDEPMTRHDIIREFKRLADRAPTEDEIDDMRPDSDNIAREYLANLN